MNTETTTRTPDVLRAFLNEVNAGLLWRITHPIRKDWSIRAYAVDVHVILITDMDKDGFQVYLPTSVRLSETIDQVKHLVMAGHLVEIPEEDDT